MKSLVTISFCKICITAQAAASSGNWWNDQTCGSPTPPPPAVCAEKTLDPFRTREVTDVMPRVFTHLQQRGEKCVQEYINLNIFERKNKK